MLENSKLKVNCWSQNGILKHILTFNYLIDEIDIRECVLPLQRAE